MVCFVILHYMALDETTACVESIRGNVEGEKKIIVVDDMNLDEIKTANVVKALKALNADKGALIVTEEKNEKVILSARNIPDVKTSLVNTINVFDILKYDSFLVTKAAVEKIQEVYV